MRTEKLVGSLQKWLYCQGKEFVLYPEGFEELPLHILGLKCILSSSYKDTSHWILFFLFFIFKDLFI